MIVVDATNLILGRMATFVAKQTLLGKEVRVINVEKAVISGSKAEVQARFRQREGRGTPTKGPFIPKMPDRYVRRVIRGMLPHRQTKGAEAYKRVLCYVGSPEEFKNEKPITLENAKASKLPNKKHITVAEALQR